MRMRWLQCVIRRPQLSGMPKSTKLARFYDSNHKLIAEQAVTASECFNTLACSLLLVQFLSCRWSHGSHTAGAFSAAYVPDEGNHK